MGMLLLKRIVALFDLADRAGPIEDAEEIDTVHKSAQESGELSHGYGEADIPGKVVTPTLESLMAENKRLQAQNNELQCETEKMAIKMAALQKQMAEERETLCSQLEHRNKQSAVVATKMNDARETYRTAAKRYEEERLVLHRLFNPVQERAVSKSDAVHRDLKADGNDLHGVPQRQFSDEDGDVGVLREMLATLDVQYITLRNELSEVRKENSLGTRLSISSVCSEEDVGKRVAQLESRIAEAQEDNQKRTHMLAAAESKAESLATCIKKLESKASVKQGETERFKGEVGAIHSRMKHMARVSLPRGAEQFMGEEEVKRWVRKA